MQRRTFLTGTLLGAAVAAVPLDALLSTRASAAVTAPVTSLDALQNAIDRAVPGDRIVLADGTYTVPSGRAVSVSGKHGTSSAPITIVSESRGGAVLQGERSFVLSNSSHITLSGFAFRQSTTLEIPASCPGVRLTRNDFRFADISGLDWVVVRGDDAKIDRNRFHDKTTEGIFVVVDGPGSTAMAQRLHIFRNHFSGHSFAGANGGEPIRLGVSSRALSSAHAVVEYNLFERCDGDPETISVKSSDNTVRHNTIRDSRGGIVLRHGNHTTTEGNYLIGGTEGVRVYGNDHLVVNNYLSGLSGRALVIGSGTTRDHHPGETTEERRGNDACDRAVIVHNTLIGNAGTLSGETRDYEPRDVVVADNLLVAAAGSLVAMGKTTGFTWQSNILWGAASNGNIPSGGYRRIDPLLRQESDGISRLTAGSPAIGAATLVSASVADDIDGHQRGTARDIGADEYTTLPPVRRPLTAADVGPNAA
ncbi:lyase precursor [Streptomyces agglomeratus]|uniref:Lyase n=1 Tax=Streptomyces agglomeratus TaxID=285458 RepID=A0A1E5P2Y4_9ACTN|nr:polysaccharide lyase 6 family protein [Streptomyces agglomeratus]OEJ23872.1 lyase precursor [Streptomyces agglomeratus]OEJ43471.1 lyase precursor [Streptomyces agglomeratus]OEJ54609.1 lyase precursor [Streptomyces agglomeratus]OEJ61981.1 lyase precursor [Streptomyces agglomeratus]